MGSAVPLRQEAGFLQYPGKPFSFSQAPLMSELFGLRESPRWTTPRKSALNRHHVNRNSIALHLLDSFRAIRTVSRQTFTH